MNRFHRILLSLLFLGPCLSLLAQPAHEMPRPADPARLADRSLILGIVATPRNLVAVGERGHVLLSQDGDRWTQADFVPVQATLTRVAYADGRLWAVGHDSAIIHSFDYGETWALQHFEPAWEKPLLDVHFFDSSNGLAVGAYGLFMRTEDGGRHWEVLDMADLVTGEAIDWSEVAATLAEDDEFDDWLEEGDDWLGDDDGIDDDERLNDDDDDEYYDSEVDFDRGCYEFMECHLNALLNLGNGRQMIAAERGYGFRSVDNGQSWESFRFPYGGSMFGLLGFGDDQIMAFGLRGHVQLSNDFGDSWEILETDLRSSLKGGTVDRQGQPLMVGSGAARLRYDPATGRFQLNEDRLGSDYVTVLIGPDGRMILGGADGLSHE